MTEEFIEVKIEKLVYGGDGMGRLPDSRVVFVPYCLPGEVVRAEIREDKKNHVKAGLVEILKPSQDRIIPRCPHFLKCGMCHYQHIDYQKQVDFKIEIFKEQLSRLAGIENPDDTTIISSELQWNYRNCLSFYPNEENKLAFISNTDDRLIPIKECHLPERPLDDIWHSLDFSDSDSFDRVIFRYGYNDQSLIIFEGENEDIPEIHLDMPISIVYLNPKGLYIIAGDDHIPMNIHNKQFRVTAPSYFYPNNRQAEELVNCVLDKLNINEQTVFLDVYCGVGLFSSVVAPKVNRCIGIEADPSACLDYIVNLDDCENVELYEGKVESILPYLKIKPDVVLLTPTKTGLGNIVVDKLLAWKPAQILYVSNDPATFSRDTKKLVAGGYHLQESVLIDMLPQTFHIESINIFSIK